MRILAFDPGGTTGIARYDSDGERTPFVSFELPTIPALDAIHLVIAAREVDLVIGEQFVIGAGTAKKTRAGSYAALHSFGAVEWMCHHYGVDFDSQTPTERKFADNEKLAKLGWRHPTPGGHCDDAARHLLVASVRRGLIDLSLFTEDTDTDADGA